MNKYTYKGFIRHQDGRRTEALLKEGANHWLDNERNRWRKSDGTRSGSVPGEGFPRLMLTSIHTIDGARPNNSRRLTHTGRVTMYASGGIGKSYKFRETLRYWVDSYGNKFKKDGGWSVPLTKARLIIGSIELINTKRKR